MFSTMDDPTIAWVVKWWDSEGNQFREIMEDRDQVEKMVHTQAEAGLFVETEGVALSKSSFADLVINNAQGFNDFSFEEFAKIWDVVSQIAGGNR